MTQDKTRMTQENKKRSYDLRNLSYYFIKTTQNEL
jgi:hypothetical protein